MSEARPDTWPASAIRPRARVVIDNDYAGDPDGIALEFYVPNERYLGALEELRTGALSDEEVRARAEELVTEQTEQ